MNPKKTILLSSITLTLIGLLFLGLSSSSESINTSGNPYFFLHKQLIWIGIGLIAFLFGKFININFLYKKSFWFYVLSIILLLIVLIPSIGTQTLGARRWIDLGFIGVQPSEISKILCLIFFSAYFTSGEFKLKNFLILIVIPIVLILLEPNLSTAVIFAATIFILYYLSGGNILNITLISLCGFAIGILLIILTPYRQARLQTLLQPQADTESSYHSNQLLLTLASGGITGKGFANSTQKYRFLPKISTDSIFAVIGEEIGFVGSVAIILLYTLLITSLLKLGSIVANHFYGLIVVGVALMITLQAVINICAVIALIPLTGVPLPFISYGGTSLITMFFAIGITQNNQYTSNLIYSSHNAFENNHHHRNSPHSRHRNHNPATRR